MSKIVLSVVWLLISSFNSSAYSAIRTDSWNVNDVSILLPLPEGEQNILLRTDSLGIGGELFSEELLKGIGILSVPSSISSKINSVLRAVAFRFDPCPAKANGITGCFPEIRIVWQPVYKSGEGAYKWTTEDVALHSFYKLNTEQLKTFKLGMLNIKATLANKFGISTDNESLYIHPAFRSKEAGEFFQSKFQNLIVDVIGKENLYKFTVMKLLVEQNWWKFLVEKEKNSEGIWERAKIADHGGFEMDIINDATKVNPETGHVDEVDASIFILPAFPKEDDMRKIVSSGFRSTMYSSDPIESDYENFKVTLKNVISFQNPKLSNPHTINCVNCHYADSAINFAKKVFPDLAEYTLSASTVYKNPNPILYNTTNNTVALKSSRVLRAFGYWGSEVSIMTRTINDSVESANFLNNNR